MPVLVDGAALLTALLVCLVCYMLLVAYKATLGALLRALAQGLHSIGVWGVHPFDFLASGVTWVDQQINAALAAAVTGTEWALAKLWNFTALLVHKSLEAVADLAEATYRAVDHVVTVEIPLGFKREIAPYVGPLHWLIKEVGHLASLPARVVHTATTTVKVETPKIVKPIEKVIETRVKAVATPVAAAVAGALPRIRSLERDLHGIDETLKESLRKVTPVALAGAFIGSILAKVGMSWLRCRNVTSAGKALCGMNVNALEGLLAGLLTIFGTLSIEAFAAQVQDVAAVFADAVLAFWRADHPGAGTDRQLGAPVAGAAAVALGPDRALGQPTSGG